MGSDPDRVCWGAQEVKMTKAHSKAKEIGGFSLAILFMALLMAAWRLKGRAQYQSQSQQPAAQQPDQQAPEAGGPSGDNGPIALPKKPDNPDNTPPPAPAQPQFKNPEGAPNMSLRVEVPEVTVDVGVLLEKTHQFVPGLKPSNFRVYEDGVEQKVEGFKRTEAPITVLMLMEYAARGYFFRVDALNSAWAFTQQLRPQDYVAMMTFDLNSHIVSDFTQDKKQIQEGINQLADGVYMPAAFQETDIFDALNEGLDRMSRVEGQKYILLVASGVDTMSKLDLDQILKRVKASQDMTIFTVSTGGFFETMRGESMTYLQAENQMRTFSDLTGGHALRAAVCGRAARRYEGDQRKHPGQIRAGVPPDKREAGRDIPQDSRGTGGRRRQAAAHAG